MYDCFNPSDNTYGLYSKNHFVIKNINEIIEQKKTEYLLKYHRREELSNDHIIVNLIKAYCHNRGLFDYLSYSLINEHGCSTIPDHVSYTEEAAVKDYISQQAAMACAQSLDNDYECYSQGISKKSSTCLQEIYTGYGFKGKLNDLDCDTLAIAPQNEVDFWNETTSQADYTTPWPWEKSVNKDEMSNSITNKTFDPYINNGSKHGSDFDKISQNKNFTTNIGGIMLIVGPIIGIIIVVGIIYALYSYCCKCSKNNNRPQDRKGESCPLNGLKDNNSSKPEYDASPTKPVHTSIELSSRKNEFHGDISAHSQSGSNH